MSEQTSASAPKKTNKRFAFRIVAVVLVLLMVEVIGYVGMVLKSRQFDFLSNGSYFRIRSMLMNDTSGENLPKYLSTPYMVYIPNPGYTKHNQVQHNTDGYRGTKVPLQRDGKYRTLCLGGSTTYGSMVDNPLQSYPARLDSILNVALSKDADFNNKYKGVEVINAGVEGGSSAEELADYLYKFRYYKADLVILHSGGNDLVITTGDKNYQPDYSHFRKVDFNIKPLPARSRWLMHSYFCSFVIINLFYESNLDPSLFFKQDGSARYSHWSTVNTDSLVNQGHYENYAFYNNFKTLVREIKSDSSDILILSLGNNTKGKPLRTEYGRPDSLALINNIMRDIAVQNQIPFIETGTTAIPESGWVDDFHLNAQGELAKAAIVAQATQKLLAGKANIANAPQKP